MKINVVLIERLVSKPPLDTSTVKPGFHYPSWRPVNSGSGNRALVVWYLTSASTQTWSEKRIRVWRSVRANFIMKIKLKQQENVFQFVIIYLKY